jgi:hypothetical protein
MLDVRTFREKTVLQSLGDLLSFGTGVLTFLKLVATIGIEPGTF